MAENSKIEWTDHTFNPWRGCAHRVLPDGTPHPGCEHCYAEAMSKRNPSALGIWGEEGQRVFAAENYWRQPFTWNRAAAKAGRIDRVFCASLADVFEDWQGPLVDAQGRELARPPGADASRLVDAFVPIGQPTVRDAANGWRRATLDDARRELFFQIDATPNLFWLLLTKRPENVRRMWPPRVSARGAITAHLPTRPNIAIGTSISDQRTADELVPKLLACRDLAPVLFLSIEPLVGPLSFHKIRNDPPNSGFAITDGFGRADGEGEGIDWVIVGGESGHHARPMHPQWARDLRDQCVAAGVPFFFKQWGEWLPFEGEPLGKDAIAHYVNGERFDFAKVGKHAAGRLLDGREWSELPGAFRQRIQNPCVAGSSQEAVR